MAEVDLELAGADFGGDHRDVDALVLGGLRHVVEHVAEARQPFDMQVGLVVGIPTERVAGKLRQAVFQLFIEQVELQLKRDHGVNALVLQAFEHLGQDFAGFEFDGRFGAVRGDEHLP